MILIFAFGGIVSARRLNSIACLLFASAGIYQALGILLMSLFDRVQLEDKVFEYGDSRSYRDYVVNVVVANLIQKVVTT